MVETNKDNEGETNHFEKMARIFWQQYECKCSGKDDCKNCSAWIEEEFGPNKESATEEEEKQNKAWSVWCSGGNGETNGITTGSVSSQETGDWNPLVNHFNSILNLQDGCTGDSDEPQFRLVGEKVPEMNQCPFDNGRGGCFKQKCFKTHRKPMPNDLTDPPASTPENRPFNFRDLPTKSRPNCVGAVFWGYINYAVSPDEFYVLPDWDFTCACTLNPKVSKTHKSRIEYPEHFRTGKVAFDEMQLELNGYMKSRGLEALQSLEYNFGQLVICSTEKYGFVRAVVLDEATFHGEVGEGEAEAPVVAVYLIDIGETLNIPYISVYTIPKCFTNIQPLVYKCSLFAVTSVAFCYSPRAKEFFSRLLVKSKAKTRIHLMSLGSHLAPFTEIEAYVVDLVVQFKNNHLRVADMLQKFGLAIRFNLLNTRPLFLNTGAISMSEALVLGVKPVSTTTHDLQLKEATTNLKKMVENTPKSDVDVEAALQNDLNVLERQSKKGTPEEMYDSDDLQSMAFPPTE